MGPYTLSDVKRQEYEIKNNHNDRVYGGGASDGSVGKGEY
jgi:hypothetical protein